MSQLTHDTAPTQYVEAGGIRFSYRRFGNPERVPLVFFNHFMSNLDDHLVARGPEFTRQVRSLAPGGVPGLVDGANLDAAALPAIADDGAIATVKGWSGPAERGITVHPISALTAVTDTALLEELRDLAEDGTLTLRVAEVMPARLAAEAHRRLAAGGIRGRIVLDFTDLG
jgi:NADPH:quinone reductase